MKLSDEQNEILRRFEKGENLFITGPGGTGKTFLIKELDRVETYDERVEIRKDLRNIREELYEAIKYTD